MRLTWSNPFTLARTLPLPRTLTRILTLPLTLNLTPTPILTLTRILILTLTPTPTLSRLLNRWFIMEPGFILLIVALPCLCNNHYVHICNTRLNDIGCDISMFLG